MRRESSQEIRIFSAIARASAPEMPDDADAAAPGGVETAAMVSLQIAMPRIYTNAHESSACHSRLANCHPRPAAIPIAARVPAARHGDRARRRRAGRSSSGRGRGGRIGSGSVFISAGTTTTWRMGPSPTLSLRTSVSSRRARCRMRRSRLFMGLKWNGSVRFLHALRRGQRAHPQLLDAQHAMVVGVEAHPRMLLGAMPSASMVNCSSASSSSALLASSRSTSAPVKRTSRSGFSKSGCGVSPSLTAIVQLEPGQAETPCRETAQCAAQLRQAYTSFGHRQFLLFFLGAGFTSTTARRRALPRFKIHC